MAAVAFKMQIAVCLIVIGLISHGHCLNVNRQSSRWARSDDGSDGWQASNGPYFSEPVVSPPTSHVTTTTTTASTSSLPSTTRVTEERSALLTGTLPEGFYEVSVGKKSPMTESLGVGSPVAIGSPDVIIGRVMPTSTEMESSGTTTIAGHSHPPAPKAVVVETPVAKDAKAEDRSDTDVFEPGNRSSETLIDKKTDLPLLPPGSFYLPAVSRKANHYFSESERAIYIPLHRADQLVQPFPVRTNVVLVNKHQPPPAPPVPHLRQEVEEREEDEVEDRDEEDEELNEGEEEEEEEENEEEQNVALGDDSVVTPPTKTHSGALDLVMTLYPNLPKLVSPSHFGSQAMKNLLKFNKPPVTENSGSTRVVHEAKVITPPQGYLPQLSPKPILKPNNFHGKPASGNTLVTQLKSTNVYAPDQRHHPTASSGGVPSAVQFTPFTPDDISPLNFLLPPASSSLDKVTATDQPDTRSNYIVAPNGDLAANTSAFQNPLKVIQAPKLDFSWNSFQPPSSEVSHQQSAGSDLVLFGLNSSHQAEKSKSQPDSTAAPKPESLNELHFGGETREIVVRSKMATSGSDSGNHVNRPGFIDSVDIVTGVYEDVTTTRNDILLPAQQNAPSRLTSSTTEPPTENQEATSTLASIVDVTNARLEDVTAATIQTDDTIKSTVATPKLFGDFQPSMFGRFPHHGGPPSRPRQPSLVPKVPLHPPAIRIAHDENEAVLSATRLPNVAEDQHVAGSQIHESNVYEENLPHILPIKQQSLDTQGKSSTPHYKKGKMSPKGAMYTVTQGHSKVKFFGFNALHNGELKSVDGKYIILQQKEPDWKFNPFMPVRLLTSTNSAIKHIPKKSIPISGGRKSIVHGRTEFSTKKPSETDQPSRSPSLV